MKRLGARVLLNEHVVLKKGNAQLVLAGVTDFSGGNFSPEHASSPEKSVAGAPVGVRRVLLAHQPSSWMAAAPVGFDLMLSGHTHGGQFFPWVLFMPFAHRYWIDLNRHEKMWIYVNRGTSYWGPPLRFTIPREITLLKLKRAIPS
jgi:predicted MPP superfamily phosphohydrolase